jgi:hypothetical protein
MTNVTEVSGTPTKVYCSATAEPALMDDELPAMFRT